MAITLEHFCTKTGKPIVVDGQAVTEIIEHCLAEYLAPNATFKIGAVYSSVTTEADLQKFNEQGLTLQFASDDRFYFMDKELRSNIFDQPHFGAAYGSNMFTPCKSFEEREKLKVLVVDASTGENGDILTKEEAIKLIGDGDGKIDKRLHESLGNASNTPFQTRFGIKARQVGLDPDESTPVNGTWQLGKGTFAPRDLSGIGNGYDLIISTDQLKGRKNQENKLGILGEDGKPLKVGNEIKPGEYTMTIGIGNKTDAYLGITSTGPQFWNSFPVGVQNDVLPRLEKRLEDLKEMASDPRQIARDYLKVMDERNKYRLSDDAISEQDIDFDNLDLDSLDKIIDKAFGNSDRELIYRILKADLSGHCQVLELPKIIDKLQEHWREQYLDCATGRFIKFDSAMAQTCHDLAENEVSIPNYPDGVEVIVYRGPTANSNTVDVYVNKHLANEPHDIGTIKMSPAGLKHSLSDCDGDRMAYILAEEFPHTTVEIKQRQQAENRYSEIIKLDKKAYQGSFEQIALDAMENKVGIIANLCMKGIALENECSGVPTEEAFKLMRDISIGAGSMLAAENDLKKPVTYPPEIRKQIVELAEVWQQALSKGVNIEVYDSLDHYNFGIQDNQVDLPNISPDNVQQFLEKSHHFYHDVVGILGGQLQIEVDRGKSANRSDPQIVNACTAIIKSFDIAPWVEEKKVDEVYLSRTMNSQGHGAIDMMIRPTNEAFEESALVARSTQQFQDLFKRIEFTPQHKEKAAELKKTYDTLINRAIEITREVAEAPGPRLIATSARGNSIEIIGLAECHHPNAFDTNRKLDIKIVENSNPHGKVKNKWVALAPIFGEDGKPQLKDGKPKYKKLGYISTESTAKYPERMKQWSELKGLTVEILPGLTQSQVKAAFKQARDFANTARGNIPNSQKEIIAAAMWELSTSGKDENATKKSSAAFAMFGDEIRERLHELQFTDFAVVGTHKASNEHLGRRWVGEKVSCEIIQAPDPANPTQNKRWLVAEGKKLGVFRSESAQLPIGTQFEATIESPPGASVIVTSSKGNQLKVGQLKKYAFPEREWDGEAGTVTIQVQNSKSAIALVDGKPLGVIDKESLAELTEKLSEKGISVQGFQFKANLESAPATIAHIKVDSATVKYPEVWTKEEPLVKPKRLSLTDALKPLLRERYPEKTTALMHDDAADFKAYLIPGDEVESFMRTKDKEIGLISTLAKEIDRKFGVSSFVAIADKGEGEELYFGILLPTDKSESKTASRLIAAFNFPLEYEQIQGGQHTKLIAVPLDQMQSLLNTAASKVQNSGEINISAVPEKTESAQVQSLLNVEPTNPLANLAPLNEKVAVHFQKDVAMAEMATQFIGFSAASPGRPSSTRNYQQAWGERANTGVYSKNDIIMVSGSGPWRGVTDEKIEQTFQQHYVPLLEKGVAAGASFVVGDAPGTDKLVAAFLAEKGYRLEQQDGFKRCTPEVVQVADASQQPSVPVREEWEKKMLTSAIKSLKANPINVDEEIQTATFGEGSKYRVILHAPTETLRVVDDIYNRGTLYKANKGCPALICNFDEAEKQSFAQLNGNNLQSKSKSLEKD
ncbi:hypothetical protein [Argonema antarcticum]|uniref:hypothetical protein n=1 Tax=Argonema antarcticum TaxID=2942763 RepID=UPI00201367E9|nr:hypothetical protein [Argonema antarcticum]MCL1474673.1 hypothetical protein [Argonema antarcticum A004/B2]